MKTEAVATRDTLATAHVINIRPLMRPDDRTDTIADRDVQARPKLELVRELQHQRGARRATVGEQLADSIRAGNHRDRTANA